MGKKLLVIILLVAFLVMGVVTYKLYNEKEECVREIESLTKEIEDLAKENEVEKIILDGSFAPDASDVGYEFDKNGNVIESGNVHETKGTYKTISENLIEIKFTEETIWDLDTNEKSVKNVDRTMLIKYLSEKELLVIIENEENTYTIQKFGTEE